MFCIFVEQQRGSCERKQWLIGKNSGEVARDQIMDLLKYKKVEFYGKADKKPLRVERGEELNNSPKLYHLLVITKQTPELLFGKHTRKLTEKQNESKERL